MLHYTILFTANSNDPEYPNDLCAFECNAATPEDAVNQWKNGGHSQGVYLQPTDTDDTKLEENSTDRIACIQERGDRFGDVGREFYGW